MYKACCTSYELTIQLQCGLQKEAINKAQVCPKHILQKLVTYSLKTSHSNTHASGFSYACQVPLKPDEARKDWKFIVSALSYDEKMQRQMHTVEEVEDEYRSA